MNDRFKFRIWFEPSYQEPEMIYEAEQTYDNRCENKGSLHHYNFGEILNDKHCKVMQCTGLKDKNGKLIYEGDIVKDPSWWWGNCYIYLHRGECGLCKGDSVMSYILCKNIETPLEGACYNIWNGKEVEVIGNIYENKELLEDNQ